jgi:hypothetical protein
LSRQRARPKVERVRAAIIARIGGALDARDRKDFDRIAARVLAALENRPIPSAGAGTADPRR